MDSLTKKNVTHRLPVDVINRIAVVAEQRNIPLGDVVEEALREKFARIDDGRDTGWGPLAGLAKEDCTLVMRLIDCLRVAPTAGGFRRAVDANLAWLLESVTTK